MSDEPFYQKINDPCVRLMESEEAYRLVYGLQCFPDGIGVRRIRGEKCHDFDRFHQEVSAALQFPDYYGHNEAALDECITDLDWLPAPWYLIHIPNAERLLAGEDPECFDWAIETLLRAGMSWAHPAELGAGRSGRQPTPFNAILSGSTESMIRAERVISRFNGERYFQETAAQLRPG
jgi:RNAse (barnase) inhibitor barstar